MKKILIAAAAAVLTLTAVGCSDDTADNAVPADVQEVVDAYTDAWNSYDPAAFLAVTAEGYTFTMADQTVDRSRQAANVETGLPSMNWQAETVGDGISSGDGPWIVAVSSVITGSMASSGISTITVVMEEGLMKVGDHIYITP